MHLLVGDADRVLAGKRRLAADHLVHHDAKRIQVAPWVRLSTLGLLRREISCCTHDRTNLGEVVLGRRVHCPRNAEVSNLHLSVGPDQNVGGLNVAMRKTAVMSKPKRCCYLTRDFAGLFRCELFVGLKNICERLPLNLFHRNEVGTFEFAPVVDAHDVGMRQVCSRLCFTPEPLDKVLVHSKLRKQHLHRNLTVKQQVARRKDVGHPAASNPLVHLVAVVDDRGCAVFVHCSLTCFLSAETAVIQATQRVLPLVFRASMSAPG